MTAQLNGILQIAITVHDMPRATAFYRDILGLKFLFGGPTMAFFDCNGVRLYLSSGEGAKHAGDNSSVYFRTTSIVEHLAVLKQKGVTIHQEPQIIAQMPDHDLWLMWIRDPEGNLLGVMEEKKK